MTSDKIEFVHVGDTTEAKPVQKTVREVMSYDLAVKGIFGRNRTIKLQIVKICDVPIELAHAVTVPEILALAQPKIAALKIKSGNVRIVRNKVKIEDRSDGLRIQQFAPFDSEIVWSEAH